MELLPVTPWDIKFWKEQVEKFQQTEKGKWRYPGVDAWKGVVCEFVVSDYLGTKYKVDQYAKGLDTSGNEDEQDMMMYGKRVQIKSATEVHYKFITPKVHDVNKFPYKDIYIGASYDDTREPNVVELHGYLTREEVMQYPTNQQYGAEYYEVPLEDLKWFKW